MPLRGELDSVDLGNVFQMLVLNQKAGTLEIVHEGAKRRLHFAAESVWIPVERDLIVGRAIGSLVRQGTVSAEQQQRAKINSSVAKKDALDTLVEMQVLTADERDKNVRAQLEEEVYELFFLRGAHFEFRDGEAPEASELDPRLALAANGLIMEAARRVDEWQYIQQLVHSGSDIFETAGDLSAFGPREQTAELRAVCDALDGVATVDEVIERTGITRFLVWRSLALLLERGAAAAVPVEELIVRGKERLEAGDSNAALRCFERAIQLGCAEVEVLTAAGRCREERGEAALAARLFVSAGKLAEDDGDLQTAIQLYLRVRGLLPSDVEARERLFLLRQVVPTHAPRGSYDAAIEGSELARIFHELGRRDALRLTLTGLIEQANGDPRQLECAADLAASLMQPTFAVEALLLAAERRRGAGDPEGALRALKQARQIDPTREDLGSLTRAIHTRQASVRGRRRTTLRALGMVAGSALFFLAYGQYSKAALDAYGRFSIEDFIINKRFAEGREHFESVRRRYPLTVPFLLSSEKLRELELHERHSAEVDEYRNQVRGEQQASNLKQARGLVDAALDARHSGDYRKALELLRRALAYCGGADPLSIATAISDLEGYLSAAARLRTEALFFRNAGRFAEAHDRLRKLAKEYPRAPDASGLVLPVRIESEPAGANIRIDGEPVRIGDDRFTVEAETPFVVDLRADRAVEIMLAKDGFAPYSTRFAALDAGTLVVTLPKRPQREVILPTAVSQPIVVDDKDLVAALASGRISALDPRTLEVRWTRELPSLAEATAAPTLVEGGILLPTTPRSLLLLDRKGGALIRTRQLPARPVSAAAVVDGLVALRCDGGVLAFGLADDDAPLETVALKSPVAVGPVALPSGRIAFGCEDGKAWVRGRDGSLSMLRGGTAAGKVTALAADGEVLWLGDDTGKLFVYDSASLALRCEVDALQGRAVERIGADPDLPAVCGGGLVAVVDCAEGTVIGTLGDGGRLAGGTAAWIAAVFPDGTLRIHRRNDLVLEASFACEEPIAPEGTMHGSDGWFAAGAGRVVGVRVSR